MKPVMNTCVTALLLAGAIVNARAQIAPTNLPPSIVHVAKTGHDSKNGSVSSPLLTIAAASKIAMPGDVILVHAGTYREWIRPERGGTGEDKRIIYRAAPGEKVFIKGSERITNWVKVHPGVWMVEIPNAFFGDYNPYTLNISGGWLEYGKWHHRGQVYLNGVGFREVESIHELVASKNCWQAYANETTTIIHGNFGAADPNAELAEINVRESIFMPERPGVNYITVDGFHILQAASNWTPPSQELQMGAIGPRLGKHWIIENCDISHAKSTGIVLGRAPGVDYADINAYGDHIIRNNVIHHCGQAGILGAHGATRSTISGNLIEEINYLREFGGMETAAIKFHHSVDVIISNNLIRGVRNLFSCAGFGIWIDWGNQGTRITRNIIYDIDNYCIHLEMNHGSILVDHNVIVGDTYGVNAEGEEFSQHRGGVNTSTEAVVYAHNLFVDANQAYSEFTTRLSGYFKPHTKITMGSKQGTHREDKWFNNIFIRRGLDRTPYLRYVPIKESKDVLVVVSEEFGGAPDMLSDYNLFLEGAKGTLFGDKHSVVDPFKARFKIEGHPTGVTIRFAMNHTYKRVKSPLVDKSLVGVFSTLGQTIEDKNGIAISVNTDISGHTFEEPTVGPSSSLAEGLNTITWDRSRGSVR